MSGIDLPGIFFFILSNDENKSCLQVLILYDKMEIVNEGFHCGV